MLEYLILQDQNRLLFSIKSRKKYEKLKKHICIRLTGEQFRKLTDVLVDEQMSKSALLRNLIRNYLASHYHNTEGQDKM